MPNSTLPPESSLTKYTYHGPILAQQFNFGTKTEGEGKDAKEVPDVRDIHLVNGSEVSLPAGDLQVRVLVERRHLVEVPPPKTENPVAPATKKPASQGGQPSQDEKKEG